MSALADKLTLDRYAMKDRATSHLRIYVGGLQDGANLEELYEHFIPFGQINGIVINRNFGFVQFQDESSAQEAIIKGNGSMFQGKSLNVKTAQTNLTVEKSRHGDDQMQDMSPAGPLNEKLPMATGDDGNDELYDNFGNYIGDQNYEEYEEGYAGKPGWEGRGGVRGRGLVRGARGRGGRGRGVAPGFRDRSPVAGVRMPVRLPVLFNSPRPPPPPRAASAAGVVDWKDRGNFERYQQQMSEYPRALPVTERNDCEIIVVSKSLTEYAEYIEGRLKRLGIVVDLLFPMEDVPIGKVLGNIASRGCLYAILVMPQNQENRSLTLTILHGLPQEHRNMPLEDALQLLSRNFQEVQRGGPSGREAVYALLGQLADGRTLTVMQYDKVIEYLQERREQQVKIELGEPLTTAPSTKTQVDLQQRILSILNDKKVTAPVEPTPPPVAPTPPAPPAQSKLLNDPTVRKALDTILQKFT